MDNYRCHQVYVTVIMAGQVDYTVKSPPHRTNIIFMSSAYIAAIDALYLTDGLIYLNPDVPCAQIGEGKLEDLWKLATIFQSHLTKTGIPPRVIQKPSTPNITNSARPRVSLRIPEPSPMLLTPNTPAPTLSSARTTQYRTKYHKPMESQVPIMIT